MSSRKKNIDPTILTDDESVFDILIQGMQRIITPDKCKGQTRFTAVVLEKPKKISAPMYESSGGKAKNPVGQFKFRAQILDRPCDPHALFKNMLDPDFAPNPKLVDTIEYLTQYTEFFSTENSSHAVPQKGDTVLVDLRFNVHSYNLVSGEYVGPVMTKGFNPKRGHKRGGRSFFGDSGAPDVIPHPSSRPADSQTPEDWTVQGLTVIPRFDAVVGRYRSELKPTTIVIHNTISGNVSTTIRVLSKKAYSYHFIIDHAGGIHQVVRSDLKAAHAEQANAYSIGVAFVNLGPSEESIRYSHTKDVSKWYEGRLTKKSGELGSLKKWEPYTAAQKIAGQKLIKALGWKHSSILQVVGHSDVSTKGKQDPGPAFPGNKDGKMTTMNAYLSAGHAEGTT